MAAPLKNYYKTLQVDPEAENEVIIAAYKRLALKYHPDTNKSPDATAQMQAINEAYAVLSDKAKRADYDALRNRTGGGTRPAPARPQDTAPTPEQARKAREATEQYRKVQEELRKRQAEAQEERARRAEAARKKAEAQRQAEAERHRQQLIAVKSVLRVAGAVVVGIAVLMLVSRVLSNRPVTANANEQVITLPGGAEMVLVHVPAAAFVMGSTYGDTAQQGDHKPPHAVTLDEYWMGKTEVTNAQFAAFVSATGYKTTAEISGTARAWMGIDWQDVAAADWQHPHGPATDINGKENHPVVHVSWDDAAAFCKWVTQVSGRVVRLPTEAEWERAARGASTPAAATAATAYIYPWGDASPNGSLLNYADKNLNGNWADKSQDDGYTLTAPVGNYPKGASPYGALDMAGNVWEWTADWYDGGYYANSPLSNPTGPATGQVRVLRGGSFDNEPSFVITVLRYALPPLNRQDSIGFRVVALAASPEVTPSP
jgi:formylglycine-generating enzyme